MRRIIFLLIFFSLPVYGGENSIKALKQNLRKALASGEEKVIARALAALRKYGGKEAMGIVLDYAGKVYGRDESVYWLMIDGIASFGDEEALAEIGRFIVRKAKSGLAHDVLYALERNRLSSKCAALIPVLHEGPDAFVRRAVRQLADIRVPEVVDALIARLKKTKKTQTELQRYLAGALSNITGKHFGTSVVNWEGWWAGNRDKPLTGRIREGRTTGTALDDLFAEHDAQG